MKATAVSLKKKKMVYASAETVPAKTLVACLITDSIGNNAKAVETIIIVHFFGEELQTRDHKHCFCLDKNEKEKITCTRVQTLLEIGLVQ